MFVFKEALIVFGVFAFTAGGNRVIRTPDKMEVDIPNYSYDRNSAEHQDNMNEEAAYWQGQGDKIGDGEKDGHQQLDDNRDKNQENAEHEKEHHENQQNHYNKEMNETYQEDRDKVEANHETNQEHYMQYHNDSNYDASSQANKTEGVTETETGNRYEEKGTQYAENGKDKIENTEVNGDSPSISYTRT